MENNSSYNNISTNNISFATNSSTPATLVAAGSNGDAFSLNDNNNNNNNNNNGNYTALQQNIDAVVALISDPVAESFEVAKQAKILTTDLMLPTREKPFTDAELTSIAKFITFLFEGTSRNFRLLALALLCNSSTSYNNNNNNINGDNGGNSKSSLTSSSLFYRFFSLYGGVSLWVRAFDICACEMQNSAHPVEVGPEFSALLFVVDLFLQIIRNDAHITPARRILETSEEAPSKSTPTTKINEILSIPILIRLRDLAKSKAFTSSRKIPTPSSFLDEIRRTSISLLREACVWASHRNIEACGIVQALIDIYLTQNDAVSLMMMMSGGGGGGLSAASGGLSVAASTTATKGTTNPSTVAGSASPSLAGTFGAGAAGGAAGVGGGGAVAGATLLMSHVDLAETLTRCCFVGKLSPQDTAALFFPYVDVAVPADHQSEILAATRRGKCEMVLRYLASSLEGVAVFNSTSPLGLRLLIDALGLAGGSTKRKMLLMHIFVVLLHAAAPHREVHINGRWSTYAVLDSAVTKQYFGARSFAVVNAENSVSKSSSGNEEDEEQDEFDVIDDDDEDVKQTDLRAEGFETDVPVSVEAEPTTFFARDATLGALLLILEREGLSRALISVLLPTVEELDPPLAEGSIALLQLLLNLMENLLSYDITVAINQALDNAIANLLKRKNTIISALIAKALPRPSTAGAEKNNSASNNNGATSSSSAIDHNVNTLVTNNNNPGSPASGVGGGKSGGNNNQSSASPSNNNQSSPNAANNNNNNAQGGSSNNAGNNNANSNSNNSNIQIGDNNGNANAAPGSLNDRIDQSKILKSNKPLTEWNLFITLDIVQSPTLMSAVVAKEKIATRFVRHLLHFYRMDGLGDVRYFGTEPFRTIRRDTAVSILGAIGVALVNALLQHPTSTNIADCEIPNTLADFFVGSLMNPDSKETLSTFMSGDYLKWIRAFTGSQVGLKLLSGCDFFSRIRSAASTNKTAEVWELVVRSFSAKPGVPADPLGRCFLPASDPRPQFFVDVLRSTLEFNPARCSSPILIVANGKLRSVALSQLFVLAARARFSNREVLFAAAQVVFEIMTLSTVIAGGNNNINSPNSNGRRPPLAPSSNNNNNYNSSSSSSPQLPEKHDPALLADCDLASQLLSMWIRMGGIDSDEWLAFESAAENHLDKHVEKPYVQSLLHSCYSQPASTEGDTPIGVCLRRCTTKLLQHLGSSPEKMAQHVFGPLKKAFDESHFYNRNDPPLPGSRRYGSLRPQLLGALAESEHGCKLLKESSLFQSLMSSVAQVAKLIQVHDNNNNDLMSVNSNNNNNNNNGNFSTMMMNEGISHFNVSHNNNNNNNSSNNNGSESLLGGGRSALMSRLQRDASALLSWAPSPSYSWDSFSDPSATDFHHQILTQCPVATINNAGAGNSNNRHENIHVALLALGAICSSDAGVELVGIDGLTSIVAIASSSLSNHAPLSNFVSTATITLSLLSQSYTAREVLTNSLTAVGTVRYESYDPSSSSKNLANAKVAFFSPASVAEITHQRELLASVMQTGTSGTGTPANNISSFPRRFSSAAPLVTSSSFPIFTSESFASANNNTTNNFTTSASGFFGGRTAAAATQRRSSLLETMATRGGGDGETGGSNDSGSLILANENLFISSNSAAIQKEPLKSIMMTLHSSNALRNKLEKLWKENAGHFSDLENKRLVRLLLAQPIFVVPDCRHLLALFFYMSKSKVKAFMES